MSDNKDKWPSEGLIGAVAQGWSTEANGGKEMDSDLAFDIATSVHRYLQSRAAQPVVLTDDRILDIADSEGISFVTDERRPDNATIISFARAILAAKEQA